MLTLIEHLPKELVGTNVLGYLSLKDIVMFERSCGSKKSHQLFLNLIPYCAAVELPHKNHADIAIIDWLDKRKCKVSYLIISLVGDNPCLYAKNIKVNNFVMNIDSKTTIESLKLFLDYNIGYKVRSINVTGNLDREVMEQLSACTGNVKQLTINYSDNCNDWLTVNILKRWKLTEFNSIGLVMSFDLVSLIVKTCTELTSIKLYSDTVDDAAVIAIAQHCPKLGTLHLLSRTITWTSLITLSERGLPLEELYISSIPHIPTADIARRCSHALSCIRYLNTDNLHQNGQDFTLLLPYKTGLTSVCFNSFSDSYIPLLTQHCHKLTVIEVYNESFPVSGLLSLCRANPLLQVLYYFSKHIVNDIVLIELIHACPHLHTLWLQHETDITDIGILALSEHCHQLQELQVCRSHKVTEIAVLQLLQRSRKLTTLMVSSSSLSEETWTQLDKNTQKRVRRICV